MKGAVAYGLMANAVYESGGLDSEPRSEQCQRTKCVTRLSPSAAQAAAASRYADPRSLRIRARRAESRRVARLHEWVCAAAGQRERPDHDRRRGVCYPPTTREHERLTPE